VDFKPTKKLSQIIKFKKIKPWAKEENKKEVTLGIV
jgi:hypothetical protein